MGINERFSRAKLWAIAVAIEHGVLAGTNPTITLEKGVEKRATGYDRKPGIKWLSCKVTFGYNPRCC